MRAAIAFGLAASDLLQAWELGLNAGPIGRALVLLRAGCPEADPKELAELSVGQRDALLLELRAVTFGTALVGLAACSGCGEQIETTLDARDLPDVEMASEVEIEASGYRLRLRPANSLDLSAAADVGLERARMLVLERCVVSARWGDADVAARDLPTEVLEAIEQGLADADPLSDIQLATVCPACGAERSVTFDIVSFLWREVEAWARRLLREIHALAVTYGWAERDILAMSPLRRQCYLELAGI
jgi:hypothetical protein